MAGASPLDIAKTKTKSKQKKHKKYENVEHVSFLVNDYEIVNQIYNPKQDLPEFSIYNCKTGKITTKKNYFVGDIEYRPINGEELKLNVVLLPEKPTNYKDVSELIDNIKTYIFKYLDIDGLYLQFATWYVLLTWVFDKFNTINYLRAMGDTGCGKTRFLNVIGGICYNTMKGSGAVSVAALKRMTNKWRGTLVVDEGDFRDSDEKNELVKYFNLGFEKDSPMINCDKNDPNKLEFYIPFCPKIIATRRQFTDKALEARCLTSIMKQTRRRDIPYVLLDYFYTEQLELRNKLLMFRFENYNKINSQGLPDFADLDIEPRLKQATYAFGAIFEGIPKAKQDYDIFLRNYQRELIEERASSFDGIIVNTMYNMLNNGIINITAQNIADEMLNDGIKTSSRTIGKHIKSLGLTSKLCRIENKVKKIIIFENQLWQELQKRYIVEIAQNMNNLKPENLSDVESKKFSINPENSNKIPKNHQNLSLQRSNSVKNIKKQRCNVCNNHNEDVRFNIYNGFTRQPSDENRQKTGLEKAGVTTGEHVLHRTVTNVPLVTQQKNNVIYEDINEDENKQNSTNSTILEFVKNKGKKGCDVMDFIEKFGEDKLNYLLKIGDLFEQPAGIVRCLE